jgi:hypothetical protein
VSPRPGGDVTNSSEFAVIGSGEYRAPRGDANARAVAIRFLREHTGQALLLMYLGIAVITRLYDVWFYQRFRVNIFYYSEPQDFFLAPMRNPATIMFIVVPAFLLIGISWLAGRRKTVREHTRWNTPQLRLVAGTSLVLLASAVLTKAYADQRADEVRAGAGRHVSFTRNDGISYNEQPLLLGSTGQFFFLYYTKRRVAEIVPVENTALMTVDLHPRSDPGTAIPTVGGVGNTPRLSP